MKIVQDCYEAFARGDGETSLSAFAPDVEWDDTRFRPEGKVHHGRDEVVEKVRMWVETWTDYSIELERVIDAGDQVL